MFRMNGLEKNMCNHYWSFKRLGQADYRILQAAAGLIRQPHVQIKEIVGGNRDEFKLSFSPDVEGKTKKTFIPAEVIDRSGMSIQHRSPMQLEIQTDSYRVSDINSVYPERVRDLINAACHGNMNWPQLRFKDRGVSVIVNAPFDQFRDGLSVKINHVALFVGRLSNPHNLSLDLPHIAARMIFSSFRDDEFAAASLKISDRSSISPYLQLSFHLMSGRKDYLPPQVR